MADTVSKQRNSNLEFYRVIVMLLIVAHHYVSNSTLVDQLILHMTTPNSIFLQLFVAWGKIGINSFVLITGYFMCTSSITVRKFLKLLLEVMTYKLVFYLVFLLSGYTPFSVSELVKAVLPFTHLSNNFVGCFLVFYLFLPFLSILVGNLTEKQHILLVLLSLAVYSVFDSLPVFSVTMNYVTWFVILFLIASFFRLHPKAVFDNTRFWGKASLACVAVVMVTAVIGAFMGGRFGFGSLPYQLFTQCLIGDSNRVLAVATGVCTFLFFKNWKLGYHPWINALGGATFGVLMFHTNSDAMTAWLWEDLLRCGQMFDSPALIVHAFGSVLGVFVVGCLVDWLRAALIEKPLLGLWDKKSPGLTQRYHRFEKRLCEKLDIKE